MHNSIHMTNNPKHQGNSMKLNPKKLLHSKWTAAVPQNKEKHFIVIQLIPAEDADAPIEKIEIEAVHSKRTQILAWRELSNKEIWQQGWQ